MFFDDLRNRSAQFSALDAVRSGGADYQFERGEYVGSSLGERPMGERSDYVYETVREMGQPAARGGYAGYSQRLAGDYTQYSGPYPSSSTFFAPAYVSDPFLGGRRNMKLGGLNLGFGLTSSLEYNDNVTRAHDDTKEDYILSMFLNVDANYPITQKSALSLSTAIGFDHYFNHPELAPYGSGDFVLNVLPGSTVAFDLKVGPVFVIIYDRMSVRPATQSDFALDSTEIFGVYQNDAGMAAMWAINSELNLAVNYMRSDAIAMDSADSRYDRSLDSVHASLAWSPRHTWSLGLEGGITWVHYPEGYNNDGTLANGGAFFSTPLGKSTWLRVAGGFQDFSFDDPPEFSRTVTSESVASKQRQVENLTAQLARTAATDTATQTRLTNEINRLNNELIIDQARLQKEDTVFLSNNRDSNDLSDYYFNVTLSNQLSSRVSQALSFGHESALNTTSNFITADYVNYGVGIIAWRGARLAVSGYYEDAQESGGHEKEDLTQWGFDTYLSYAITPRVRAGVGYHYGNTDSSREDRSYVQHAFNADVNFAINRKCTVALGYRYWTTDADTEENSFDQNRIIMAVNYSF